MWATGPRDDSYGADDGAGDYDEHVSGARSVVMGVSDETWYWRSVPDWLAVVD